MITIYNWTDYFQDIKPTTDYDIEHLKTNGYMILRNHFDVRELYNLVNADFNKLTTGNPVRTKNVLLDYPTKDIAFNQPIIDICNTYYQHIPFLSNINIKRNFASRPQVTETLKYHEDPEADKLIKVFIYLNDVDINHGPFTYVRGSHKLKIPNNKSKIRWTDDEIEAFYGKDNIHHLTGSAGDVIIADTSGFHKGLHLKEDQRTMLTLYYLSEKVKIKPSQVEAKMSTQMYNELSVALKPVAYFTGKL